MTARKYKGAWWVDFRYERRRVRKKSPVNTKRGAEEFERLLRTRLLNDEPLDGRQLEAAPTLEEFTTRFFEDYCTANKQKPSGIESKRSTIRNHLGPLFAKRRMDSFTPADEDRLKRSLHDRSASTYNNAASTMNSMLKAAKRWGLVTEIPHHFELLKRVKPRPAFYDFDEYQWLAQAAGLLGLPVEVLVRLGGEAGLRRGEIIALEWPDVDLRRELLTVQRSEWKGQVTPTKGMDYRVIPLTRTLSDTLRRQRHLRGDRVLYTDRGETVTAKVLQRWMAKAQKRAGLRATGGLHILRHTFCSHLAMRGAPALSIQRLAGHKHLQTTLRYMHLSPGETERAIRLLDAQDGHHLGTSGGSSL